jgi:hypothetical protein
VSGRSSTATSVKRWALGVTALLCLSCGSDSGSLQSRASSAPADARAWIAGHLPDSFEIVSAGEQRGTRSTGYGPDTRPWCETCERESQIAIAVSPTSVPVPAEGRDPRPVRVRGHDATLTTLTDEGEAYGFQVVWNERDDLRIAVDGINGPTEDETLKVANDVRGISEAEWQRLVRALSIDTHIGRVDPTATPVDVVHGAVDGAEYVLTALVPGDYPLGPEDRRLDCFRLAFKGAMAKDQCPGHPLWERVAGKLFVYGDVDANITTVRVSPSYGSSFAPFTVDTFSAPTGPPTRFYVAPLPDSACGVSVDDTAGGQPGPGTTGPLLGKDDDYTRCAPLMRGDAPPTPSQPTTPTPSAPAASSASG